MRRIVTIREAESRPPGTGHSKSLRAARLATIACGWLVAVGAACGQNDLGSNLERSSQPAPFSGTAGDTLGSAAPSEAAAIVAACYAIQGRTPDAQETAFWTQRLNSGASAAIIGKVLSGQTDDSAAARRLTLEYRTVIGHDPAAASGTTGPGASVPSANAPETGSTAPVGTAPPAGQGSSASPTDRRGNPLGGLVDGAKNLAGRIEGGVRGAIRGTEAELGKLRSAIASRSKSAGKDALRLFHEQPEGMQRVETKLAGAVSKVVGPLVDKLFHRAPELAPELRLVDVDGLTVLMAGRLPQPSFETQSSRQRIDLAGPWRRHAQSLDAALTMHPRDKANLQALEAELAGAQREGYDDSAWDTVTLPSVSDTMSGRPDRVPTHGPEGLIYRKTVEIDLPASDAKVRFLDLGANYVTDLWVNGHHAGCHEGGFACFALEIGPFLHAGPNTLLLRIHAIPWGSLYDTIPHARCDWFNYGGPYRPMAIEVAPAYSIDNAFLTWDGAKARVRIVVSNAGKHSAQGKLKLALHGATVNDMTLASRDPADLAGDVVATLDGPTLAAAAGKTRAIEVSWDVGKVKTWTPSHPDLYVLDVSLESPGSATGPLSTLLRRPVTGPVTIDRLMTQVGFRVQTIDPATPRLLLTGEPIPFLAGVTRHEESMSHGRAVTPEEIVRDLRLIKNGLGAFFIRTAHYPNDPLTYLVADRLGIAIWEEIPVYWFSLGEEFRRALDRGVLQQMWREMVMRDFNRPSVLFWGACNECGAVAEREDLIKALRSEVQTRYPDGRWIGQADAADVPGAFDPSQDAASVGGWNLYFGIGFEAADDYKKDLSHTYPYTRDFLARAHADHPHLPLVCTEYGYWATIDNGLAADQVRFFQDAFQALRESGAAAGCCWWSAFDYYSEIAGVDTFGAWTVDRATERPVATAIRDAYGRSR